MGRRPVVLCLQPRGLSLESPPPGCFLCRYAVFPGGWCRWWLFSLVAGVAVALCRHWCEVPGVPGWHVERREGAGATVVVLPVWVGPLISIPSPSPWHSRCCSIAGSMGRSSGCRCSPGIRSASRWSCCLPSVAFLRSSGSCRLQNGRGASRTPPWVC